MADRRAHFGLGAKLAMRFRFRNKRPCVTLSRWCREVAAIDPIAFLAPFTQSRTVQVNHLTLFRCAHSVDLYQAMNSFTANYAATRYMHWRIRIGSTLNRRAKCGNSRM